MTVWLLYLYDYEREMPLGIFSSAEAAVVTRPDAVWAQGVDGSWETPGADQDWTVEPFALDGKR